MKKCLLFVRTSTSRQETESQLKETREYAESLGYDEFVTLERRGSSAYKVTDDYLELIEEMKKTIMQDSEIKAVVCWAMNRLFRNITIADELKNWFVTNKIQLEIREPHIRLLEPDGSLSNSSEMIFYFFSVYSKQQIDELRRKSSRAKNRCKGLHQFIGGKVRFGYDVVDKQVVAHPTEAQIVKEIFSLYAEADQSYKSVTNEINDRYGLNIRWQTLKKIVCCELYYDGAMYPPLITKEQFDRCIANRREKKKILSYKHFSFANRLIKCPICGNGYTANGIYYRCANSDKSKVISIQNVDGLLWLIASHLEGERMMKENNRAEYEQKIAVLEAKIKSVDSSTQKWEKKAARAKKMALDGLIEIDEYKAILNEIDKEQRDIKAKVESWQAEIVDLRRILIEDKKTLKKILNIAGTISNYNEQQMRQIVRKWVKRITIDGDIFTIETLVRSYKARYYSHSHSSKWLTMSNHPIVVRPIVRQGDTCFFGDTHAKTTDLPATLAWLSGSGIV